MLQSFYKKEQAMWIEYKNQLLNEIIDLQEEVRNKDYEIQILNEEINRLKYSNKFMLTKLGEERSKYER